MGEGDGSNDGIVLDTHFVVVLISFAQSSQDADARWHVGLIDHDALESTLQRLVFLKVFLVLVECGCSNRTQFASGQSGFQNVGGIHGSLALAGTHKGMDFINEEDDLSFALGNLVDNGFQTFLKLSLVLGTCNKGTHVKRIKLLVTQVLRHVAAQNTMGKAFDDGCFTRAGFAYQDRVVLGASRKNLKYTADFLVSSDDGVEPSCTGFVNEVLGILRQTLVGVLT